MPGKVLKIDVVVDENGEARRALSTLEGGVKKVEEAARTATPSVRSLDDRLADWDKRIAGLNESIDGTTQAVAEQATQVLSLNLGIGAVLTVAGAAGAAIYTLGSYVKDATEYYIEQSGVLEINRGKIDELKQSWDLLKYATGEVLVGGAGDFRGWVELVNVGLLEVGTHILAAIELYKQLGRVAMNPFSLVEDATGMSDDPGALPGIDTTMRNPDGSLTPYGRMVTERNRAPKREPTWGDINGDPLSGASAERITNEEIARQKREQLELEREQKREAAERQRIANEQVRLENEMTQAILRSKEAYDKEIRSAEELNAKTAQRLDMRLRDQFLQSTLSKGDYQQNKVDEDLQQNLKSIDPRAANAAELARRYQAEHDMQLLQLKQASEGFTQGIADDLHALQIQYADVIGQIPAQFQAVIPPVVDASGQMRDAVTSDLDAIGGAVGTAAQSFVAFSGTIGESYDQVAARLKALDDAYFKAGFFVQRDINVTRLRGQQTGGRLYGGGGYVEPQHLAGGGGAGTDTVPAWLTPGEGVLSRTGMSALDRLNSGLGAPSKGSVHVTIEKGAIDARGAQFSDEAALDSLADRIAMRVSTIAERTGARA